MRTPGPDGVRPAAAGPATTPADPTAAYDPIGGVRDRILRLGTGYREGAFDGRRYGVTCTASPDGRRIWLFGEELGGLGRVSCNLYRLAGGRALLKPCEMPAETVIDFVLRFRPDPADRAEPDGTRSRRRRLETSAPRAKPRRNAEGD